MPKLVVRVSEGLKRKIAEAAEDADMLPTEYIRDLLRAAFETKEQIEKLDEADTDG